MPTVPTIGPIPAPAMWCITGEDMSDSGCGGVVHFFALTSDELTLPDVLKAYRAVAPRSSSLYKIKSVELVYEVTDGPFGLTRRDKIADQRPRAVAFPEEGVGKDLPSGGWDAALAVAELRQRVEHLEGGRRARPKG